MSTRALERVFNSSMSGAFPSLYEADRAWDLYSDWLDRQYRALIEGRTCIDCAYCRKCEFDGHEGVGWCVLCEDFVDDTQEVKVHGCEHFES